MDFFNSIINFIFNIVFFPFKSLDPVWGMIVVSLVTGILMLMIYRVTSDQAAIKRTKNLVKGHFLAIRLYRDDISLMFETMGNIIKSNLGYMKQSLRPMLFIIIPVALILIQLGIRYEYRPLNVGESTILSLQFQKNIDESELLNAKLILPEGLSLTAQPVRIAQKREVSWRIKAEQPGDYEVVFEIGEGQVKKEIQVVDALVKVTPEIAKSFTTKLMYPGEPGPDNPRVASVSLIYPRREFSILGLNIHWLIAFFVLSVIFGFAFKGVMGVEV